jgi:hypothetical protein
VPAPVAGGEGDEVLDDEAAEAAFRFREGDEEN